MEEFRWGVSLGSFAGEFRWGVSLGSFAGEFRWGVKGVKELSLPSVAEELRQQPWRICLVFNFKSTKAIVLTP
jgi:hypothetical protein